MFVWYALQRTFAACDYPMWANAMQLWPLTVPAASADHVDSIVYAIAFAQNECVETTFPAGNPVAGAPALHVSNPMSPISPTSFWNTTCAPVFQRGAAHPAAQRVVDAVTAVYDEWTKEMGGRVRMPVSYTADYFVGKGVLTQNAGIVQIREYADINKRGPLSAALAEMGSRLRELFITFNGMLHDSADLGYFTRAPSIAGQAMARSARPGPVTPPPPPPGSSRSVRRAATGKKK
jgi:hypothetical protein